MSCSSAFQSSHLLLSPVDQYCLHTFGPHAGDCRGGLDFTLLFEDTILSLLPLLVFIAAASIRLMYLSKRSIKLIPNHFISFKLAINVVYAVLQLALLALWGDPSTNRTKATTTAISLSLIAAAIFCALSHSEHRRSVKPSTLLTGFVLLTLLFDIARARTLWLRGISLTLTGVFTAATAVKFVVLLVETVEKRRLLRPGYCDYPPEATSGIINRSLFWWLNPLFLAGFCKTLEIRDLFTLDKRLLSENLHESIQIAWSEGRFPSSFPLFYRSGSHTFVSSEEISKCSILHSAEITEMATTFWNFPTVMFDWLQFLPTIFINAAIAISQKPISRETTNAGCGLIGAYILVYLGIAVSTGQFQHRTYRAITMMRGGLIAMLYGKVSDLSVTALDPSASVTLMSADIERITTGWQTFHELWANLIEIGLAIFLLYRQLGVACAIPVGVALFSMMGSIVASGLVMARQALWLQAIEKRITATAAMLGSMKGVKMAGLTDILLKIIQDLRKFRKILVWNMAFSFSTPVAAPILTFTLIIILAKRRGDGSTLDTSKVFTSLSLFTLLSEPLGSFVMALANFMGSVGSFQRIQAFLDTGSHVDDRKFVYPADSTSAEYLPFQKKTASGSITDKSQTTLPLDVLPEYATYPAIVVQDRSFSWDKEKPPILNSMNLTVPRHKFTMIVGPVGCGKSTLLKMFLGETVRTGGTVQALCPEIAFCNQTPWHMNGTIRQSIIGFSKMDETWYKSVISACSLKEDFKQLPRGDSTLIGSNGVALSGGQSQRISLARAVYAKKDIMLLDDVFSGLDTWTENRIFHDLLGQRGLLRKHQMTVVVASSSSARLPYADHIIVLNDEGKVSEQGTFSGLGNMGGYISKLNLPTPEWKVDPEIVPVEDASWGSIISKEECRISTTSVEAKDAMAKGSGRGKGDMSVYYYYISAVGWLPTVIFAIGICGFVVCFSLPAIWVKWWAAANAKAPYKDMSYYLGIYGLIGALALICLMASSWQMIITMVPRSGENFHHILLKTVLSSPMSFFSSTDTGETLNRFSQDLQLIDMELPLAALNTFATFILCIAQVVIIGVSSVYAAISFPIILVVLYFIQKVYLRTSRQLRLLDLEAKSPLYSQFLECLSGLATIRSFGWGRALEKKSLQLLDESQRPFYQLFAVQRWLTLVLDLLVAGIAILLIVLVVTLRGTLTAGFVGVALLNVILFSQSIKLLITFWTNLETHIGSIARIKAFTTDAASEDLPSETEIPTQTWPAKGSIEFKNVSAAYNRPSEFVLKNISLPIEAGQKIGICGRTGSGKSSLVLSLFRMIELSSGSISIDGTDISTIPRRELRSRLNGVPQDAYFLSGSVRLNIDPRNSATDLEITKALKRVQLWDIVKEKGGLDTDIEALFLSHGQRQLFCLARAMVRKSTILVLDEATSSVDSKTEELMQRVIREFFFSQTIIAVAHRLDTILDFDKVAVLDNGELVEFDSPYALLVDSSSAFNRLYYSTQAQIPDEFDSNDASILAAE
ncbi:ABC multidrug transporter [Xylogone sp. PMI_703]|nr:ABC multidrug transporter [Xylogone sp. PMI_703]